MAEKMNRIGFWASLAYLAMALVPPDESYANDASDGKAFAQVVQADNIDYRATGTFANRELKFTSRKTIEPVLDKSGRWTAGDAGRKRVEDRTFGYRLAFKNPLRIGAMTVRFSRPDARVKFWALKPNAPYPGDVANPKHWIEARTHFQHGGHEVLLPAQTDTRAFYCEQIVNWYDASILQWRCYEARLFNATKLAVAQGEWLSFGTSPTNIIRGQPWRNVGAHYESGEIARSPVSDIDPTWVILNWRDPQIPCAIRLQGNVRKFKIYSFVGGDKTNPALAPKTDWIRLNVQSEQISQSGGSLTHLVGFRPRRARAMKLLIEETVPANKQIVTINEFTALVDLGNGAVPAAREELPSEPPVALPYELATGGDVALVIEDQQGNRIRNLVAQVGRQSGVNREPWNLKDQRGHMVPPGKYRWHGIYAPPLELIYRHTPYPNVEMYAPGRLPWNYRTQDGWLANHTNHTAIHAAKDKLYIATGGTEGGHASLGANLKGQKLRGHGWGAHQNGLFSDGENLFIHTGGGVQRLDPQTGRTNSVFNISNSSTRRGRVRGLAADDGKIYIAQYDSVPFFQLATGAGNVDQDNNFPRLPKQIPTKEFYNIPSEPRADMVRLFRLGSHVPGLIAREGITHITSTHGAGARQFVVLAFNEPVPLGSLVFPRVNDPKIKMDVSVLKPGSPYPPLPGVVKHWQTVSIGRTAPSRERPPNGGSPSADTHGPDAEFNAFDCVPLPPDTTTRGLRLTFSDTTRDLDLFAGDTKVEDLASPNIDDTDLAINENTDAIDFFADGNSWRGQLEGMRLLRRRFQNVAGEATVRVNSGTYDPKTGIWDAERKSIIQPNDPGIFALEWDEPRKLRGLAIKEIAGAKAEVDIYVGQAAAPNNESQTGSPRQREIDFSGDQGWQRVATYTQSLRSGAHNSRRNNARAVYIGGTVDFGAEYATRAVRLRIVAPHLQGLFKEQTGNPARHCKVYGVAALEYLGGEPPINDKLLTQRLETRDSATGKLLHETASPVSGDIAVSPAGELYGVVGRQIARIDPKTGEVMQIVATDVKIPGVMEIDHHGRLYVFDYDRERHNIRVYKPGGKSFSFSHTVGEPGIAGPGLRDPRQLDDATSFTVDQEDNLWAVYPHVWPRRVTHFRSDGTYVKEMLGNTLYGGGGTMDRYDKSRVYYMDMEFEVDADAGRSRIKAFNTRDHNYSNPWFTHRFRNDLTAVKVDGRRYLVTQPLVINPSQPAGWVHLVDEKTRAMKLVAGIGSATSSDFFRTPEFTEHLNGKNLATLKFIWADNNGDERPQPDEVQFSKKNPSGSVGRFSLDMSVATPTGYYRVKEFSDTGVPEYEEVVTSGGGGHLRLSDGNFFRLGEGGTAGQNRVVTPTGKALWNYPAWNGVSGLWILSWSPGVVGNQLVISGHEVAPEGDLGEFVVVSANTGQMNIWTSDGLLAGLVTYSARDPRRRSFPGTNKPGTPMNFYSQGQEHFHAFFTRTEEDDRYYIITGGNHVSIVEVRGLDKFKRINGQFEVTPEMIYETREWDAVHERKENFVRADVAECFRMPRRPQLDGAIGEGEWPAAVTKIHREIQAELRMGYDDRYLYLAWKVTGAGSLTNAGDDFRRYFKTGGALDLQIAANPIADPDRRKPVEGDLRLLLTRAGGKPVGVLYRAVAPKPSPAVDRSWSVSTPAGGTTHFDEVLILPDVRISNNAPSDNFYTVEAAVPLKSLGLVPRPGLFTRMDWGVISTDSGFVSSGRNYWANATAVGVTDEPTEARLTPDLWGHIRFHDSQTQVGPALPGGIDPLKRGKNDKAVDDFLEELQGD